MQSCDVLIIGGGPAGLAAATSLYGAGVKNILLLEREKQLGGILRQCIHDGFGLMRFGASLSGPEYAWRFIEELERMKVPYRVNTSVTALSSDRIATVVSPDGVEQIKAKAIVLAMGCRERTRGALAIPGERPSGVFTAGVAQNYTNLYNLSVGKEAVILGSGDIGLIMARRLTLEGTHVKGVYEILPYPSGLNRNIRQCLDDYNIPLYLSHTVTEIHGGSRLTGVTVSRVDGNKTPISGTETEISCDTLILSVGLIPENELSLEAGVKLDQKTKGALVDNKYQTSIPGIFAAGNVLHVHDLVDYVSLEAERLAASVKKFLIDGASAGTEISVNAGNGVNYVLPQKTRAGDDFVLSLRVGEPIRQQTLLVKQGNHVILEKKLPRALPAEMLQLDIDGNMITENEAIEVLVK